MDMNCKNYLEEIFKEAFDKVGYSYKEAIELMKEGIVKGESHIQSNDHPSFNFCEFYINDGPLFDVIILYKMPVFDTHMENKYEIEFTMNIEYNITVYKTREEIENEI